MVCFQVSEDLEICVNYKYDQKSNNFLSSYRKKFENYVTRAITKIFRENKDLINARKLNILIDLNVKNSEFSCRNKTENGFTIAINPIKLSADHENIVEYLKLNLPPSKWFIWKKFYGRNSTFNHFIEHEIRHYLDGKEKELEIAINNYIKKEVSGTWILFLKFINQIRSEAYPKLFDSSGDLRFFGDELIMIKDNLFKAIKKEELSEEYCLRYKQKPNWREAFFVALESGNHIYTLSRYMAYVIAYSFTSVNIGEAIEKGTKIVQPNKEAKNKAAKLIRNLNPFEFAEKFDKAANKLKIPEKYRPLSRKSIIQIRLFLQEHEKEHIGYLVKKWKQKKITFLDLKEEINQMMLTD